MTTEVDIINRALLMTGLQKRINSRAQDSAEAQAANLIFEDVRDDLLRMAPWNCGLNTANLTYITSAPGTPENTSPTTATWQRGQPSPPWAYEYQYPIDCLRACWMVAAAQTGYAGVPITTAVTGGAPSFWCGLPIRFRVAIDQFLPVTAAAVVAAGAGYAVGDLITLPYGAAGSAPIGAPAVLRVLTLAGSGVATVEPVTQIYGSTIPQGGSYFQAQTGTIAQSSTTGSGTGATFSLTFGAALVDQRVILTNQEYPTLAYVRRVTDPNVMDETFQDAWTSVLGSRLVFSLTGEKDLANSLIKRANNIIEEARKNDGNEGLTINNVTPDWIRVRGINYSDYSFSPGQDFSWGNLWTTL